MKICLTQLQSLKNNWAHNLTQHLQLIRQAVAHQVDLVVFPELSLTNYEPTTARHWALPLDHYERLAPLQQLASQQHVVLGVGTPIQTAKGLSIGLVFLFPYQKPRTYLKQHLHEDEQPFFVAGEAPLVLPLGAERLAFGICYESLQRAHWLQAQQAGATLYVASVAKPAQGVARAQDFYPKAAVEFGWPVLMVNALGPTDNFVSAGQSAIWNAQGIVVQQGSATEPGFLIWDTTEQSASSHLLVD